MAVTPTEPRSSSATPDPQLSAPATSQHDHHPPEPAAAPSAESSESILQTPLRPSPRSSQRFVMNKIEKEWIIRIIRTLIAHNAPMQKQRTLDQTCSTVAKRAQSRHVPDSLLVEQQNKYHTCWRRAYMARITQENVRNFVNSITDMAKKVVVSSMEGNEDYDGPIAAARGVENDAQQVLDQAVLDFKHEASKRTLTTDDNAERAMNRNSESRTEKEKRNGERKETFEKNKRLRQREKEERERRRTAAELQNLKAQTRIANAAAASASLQRRQSEQFGILVGLFARSNNLTVAEPRTPLPPPLPIEPLSMDPNLAAAVPPTADCAATTEENRSNYPAAPDEEEA